MHTTPPFCGKHSPDCGWQVETVRRRPADSPQDHLHDPQNDGLTQV
ncbi:hypothetical protein HMPREF9056_02415 [Actinomyces sp. oral taxon 170 str. F0386]|nr:hypothetical protein HMPREF9056_02415 [Actinomyces sp. oral taxon 170 str. F0386]